MWRSLSYSLAKRFWPRPPTEVILANTRLSCRYNECSRLKSGFDLETCSIEALFEKSLSIDQSRQSRGCNTWPNHISSWSRQPPLIEQSHPNAHPTASC